VSDGIAVRATTSWRDRRRFQRFPWAIYAGDPNWVPPILSQERPLLGWGRHPFFANAEMVISGRVVDVRDVPHNEPITEHDPKWREAIVHVDTVAKCQQPDTGQDTVVVRFAASKDIKWHRAPKFHVDQQGVWILGNAKAPLGLAAVGGEPNTYTVVDPRDFHPAKELPRVQSLVAESGGGS
jgi:hypothetical protein